MKKILLLIAFCISLVGCTSLPPVGSISYTNDGEQKQTRLTEDTWKVEYLKTGKIEYSTFINFKEKNKFPGKYIMITPTYYSKKDQVIFKVHSTNEEFMYSLIFKNSKDTVIFNMAPYDDLRLKFQEIHDFYNTFNRDKGNTIFFTNINSLKKLSVILESNEEFTIILDCYRGEIPYTLSKKDKRNLIDFIKYSIDDYSLKGSN